MFETTVIDAYSRMAREYERENESSSCWSRSSRRIFRKIRRRVDASKHYQTVVDVGCGTGESLRRLALPSEAKREFIGIEPAANLRERAEEVNKLVDNVRIINGRFEQLSIPDACVDYLYSIYAFHWTTDAEQSAREIARVLSDHGEMDLFFAGRFTGREFIKLTTPLFLRRLGASKMLRAATLRCQLTIDEAEALFRKALPNRRVKVRQLVHTYYDSMENHMKWWVRFEGQLCGVSADIVESLRHEMETAIGTLKTPEGIPYTIEVLQISVW